MSKKISENDYLHISARVRVLENRLLTRARTERMLDAPGAAEAARVLTECGYRELGTVTAAGIEELLAEARQERFQALEKLAPDPRVVELFRMKYDYHNVKVLLKAGYMGVPAKELLASAGRYAPASLSGALSGTSPALRQAAETAGELLSATGDGQRADFILDAAYYAELLETVRAMGSAYLTDYVRVLIDAANLRTAVRVKRMDGEKELLEQALVEGGNIPAASIAAAGEPETLAALFRDTPLAAAAQAGAEAAAGGGLTRFERLCDNAVTAVVRRARQVPFGEQPVAAYLYAREAEETAIRIILNGKLAGLSRATMEERLRDAYV